MAVFDEYARYYDLLYRDKDYQSETIYTHKLIERFSPGISQILDLGCGSGQHDRCFAKQNCTVTGVDVSERMIENARNASHGYTNLSYVHADLRSLRLPQRFDAVVSLFHVMSYQIENQDLMEAFTTAYSHLKPGGIFLFDFWHGPAVLTERPEVRIKEFDDTSVSITRIAQPFMHASENRVDVEYQLFVQDKTDASIRALRETHRMRYLFVPELRFMLTAAGFTPICFEEWLTSAPLGFNSWNAVAVAQKNV